jgi:predicted nucleotidyltransferase
MLTKKNPLKITKDLTEQKVLNEFIEGLLKIHPDAEIILYGSRARGNYNKDSDIDVLVLLDAPITAKLTDEILDMLYTISSKYEYFNLESLIENRKLWYSPKYQAMPIAENINKEGIVLYEPGKNRFMQI